MNLVISKSRFLIFIKFACIGGLNTLLTYALYYVLSFYLSFQISFLISYVAGIAVSYVLNSLLVFKKRASLKGVFLYPFVYVIQYGISALLLHVIIITNVISPKLAPLIITILLLPLTYVLSKMFIHLGAK